MTLEDIKSKTRGPLLTQEQVRGIAVSDMSPATGFNRGRNVKAVNIEEFEPFVDADRAAEFLSIDRETIIRWARKGTIPGHPLGAGRRRVWRFRYSELSTWAGAKVQSGYRPCSERQP